MNLQLAKANLSDRLRQITFTLRKALYSSCLTPRLKILKILKKKHHWVPGDEGLDPNRWMALVVIAIASLMIVLDASIINLALPSAQKALHISNANRQWVVTAYSLTFGSLLLLGGRIADYVGRKKVFMIGLLGFAVASAIGGFSQNQGELFAMRGLQAHSVHFLHHHRSHFLMSHSPSLKNAQRHSVCTAVSRVAERLSV